MKSLTHSARGDSDVPVYVKLATVTMLWGGTFVAGRFLAEGLTPLFAASLRFLLASGGLLLFMVGARVPLRWPTWRQWVQLGLLGFFGIFFYNLCFFYGLHYINASRASLIVALNPAVIALASWLLFKERLGRHKVVGIAVCIAGAGVVIVSRDQSAWVGGGADAWIGDLLILGCVLGWGIYSLFSKGLNQALGPLHTVTYSIVLGTLMLWAASALRGELSLEIASRLQPVQMLSLLYLGVLGSALAYIWYYDGIGRIGATRAGVFIALNPLTAVIFGVLLLGEQMNVAMYLGGGAIVLGIYLCNKPLAPARKRRIL